MGGSSRHVVVLGNDFEISYSMSYRRCKYHFPQSLNQRTYVDEKGYVHHKRRHNADAYVVPYNLQLLKTFDCHINVEISHSVVLMMYLYKYFYKGKPVLPTNA